MKEVTTYIAFDDTEFDDEEECRQYEVALVHLKGMDKIHGFNSKGKPIVFNEKEETIVDFWDRLGNTAFYFHMDECPSDELREYFRYMTGADLPNYEGWSRYDTDTNKWYRLKDDVAQLLDNWRAVIPDGLMAYVLKAQ